MGLNDNCIRLIFKYFVILYNQSKLKFELCCTGPRCVGVLGRTFLYMRVLACTFGVMHDVLRSLFYNFVQMALPTYIGVLYIVLSHCVHCAVDIAHFVDAGGRKLTVFAVVGCGFRLLALSGACIGSWVPVFFVLRSLLPYTGEEWLYFVCPSDVTGPPLFVCYDRAVLVLCMSV